MVITKWQLVQFGVANCEFKPRGRPCERMLVSGDRDLLALAAEFETTFACSIVTLDEFARVRLVPRADHK